MQTILWKCVEKEMLMQSALASARDRLCSRSHRAKLCFTCPAHGLDGFIKNICGSKQEIQMQRNEMGGVGVQHVSWDEDFFEKAFAQA
jgi:hypothetical protein